MMGTEQPAQVLLLTTEIGGAISITNKIRTDTANRMDPTIQTTIFHFNQATGPGHSDRNHFPLGSLYSSTDFPISGRNIDNRTGMNPQVHIVATIIDSNRTNKCSIFN